MNTYRIEELDTTGWILVENFEKLPKEQAKEKYDFLVSYEGRNPNRLRIVVDGTLPT